MMEVGGSISGVLAGLVVGIAVSLSLGLKVKEERKREMKIPEEFREEQLSRNRLYFGEENMQCIKSSRVLVVGCGGIGSHAAVMLARSGIESIGLIDDDDGIISPECLKHHACATMKSVGLKKLAVLQQYILEVNDCLVTPDLSAKWDFIVDTTDDVAVKSSLMNYCVRHKIKVISCMNMENKSDPTRLHIGDLVSASRDLMATQIRHFLHDGDSSNIRVVYSSQTTNTISLLPSIVGQMCASWVLCQLGNKPFQPSNAERTGRQFRHRLWQHLKYKPIQIDVDVDDVEFIFHYWNCTCAFVPYVAHSFLCRADLELMRWDISKPAAIYNLLPLCPACCNKFNITESSVIDMLGQHAAQRIQSKLLYLQHKFLQSHSNR